jgi:hypothetical protein
VIDLSWVGIGLLVVSVVAIAVEGAFMAAWSFSIAKRAKTLTARMKSERAGLEADMQRLRAATEEMKRLWEPYRKALRWLQNPLLIALLGSYRRRLALR